MIGFCYVCSNAVKETNIKYVGANEDGAILQHTCDDGHQSFLDAHGDVLRTREEPDGVC